MVEIFVNNTPVRVPAKSTVLEACEAVGITIPRFCYNHRLNIAGNCRICLVEIEKSPKPQASCALPVIENMRVYTDTPLVKKARESVLEFLLLNHPLDCPICDQGGECDLQDQTIVFGSDRSRFYERKRGVEDKFLGPFVKTIMTRCIHCTRCVRFAEEIAGVPSLGTTIRGRQTEIGTYIEKIFQSEVSGNVVDLCPVGALTSKPYAFTARPWEIQSIETIDLTDGLGSNIRIDRRGQKILRALPIRNDEINEDWITDKARYSFEGSYLFRQAKITMRPSTHKGNSIGIASWDQIGFWLKKIFNSITSGQLFCGSKTDLRTVALLKHLTRRFGWDMMQEESRGPSPFTPLFYQSSISLTEIEKSDYCIIVGTNPQKEGWALHHRLHKNYRNRSIKATTVGNCTGDICYPTFNIGITPYGVLLISEGKASAFNSNRPLFVFGNHISIREDGGSIQSIIRYLSYKLSQSGWIGVVPIGNRANTTGLRGLGVSSLPKYKDDNVDLTYFVGNEAQNLLKYFNNKWVIYQHSHFPYDDKGKDNINIALPSASTYEQSASYINIIGDKQKTQQVCKQHAMGRTDSSIIRWLALIMDFDLGLAHEDLLPVSKKPSVSLDLGWNKPSKTRKTVLTGYTKKDSFGTDRMCRSSLLLFDATAIHRSKDWNFAQK